MKLLPERRARLEAALLKLREASEELTEFRSELSDNPRPDKETRITLCYLEESADALDEARSSLDSLLNEN